jgi:GAF domain-containing protein
MGRRGKPAKSKAEAKPPVARKSPKDDGTSVRDLTQRLAEALAQLQTSHRELAEAHEQQTATAEILRVIASSPTDLQPVLDAVAENAARVCGAGDALIRLLEGDVLRLVANYGPIPGEERLPLDRRSAIGRAMSDRRTIHIHDLAAESESEFSYGKSLQRRFGHRTVLATPLFREGTPIGGIVIRRLEMQPFSDKQIELLKTFADQAVIAIENVRLFNETKEALEQQTATAEILRVINQSPTDLTPVARAIAETAARLCETTYTAVFRFDGELIHWVAAKGASAAQEEALRIVWPRPATPGTLVGRTILGGTTLHIEDVAADPTFTVMPAARTVLAIRTVLNVPMLRDGRPVGVIGLIRSEVKPFSAREISLVQTFADQAVIAIENVRLFTALEARNRDLTATSQILQVISRSPTDIQPVFDAIARNASALCDGEYAIVVRLDGDVLHLVAQSNTRPGVVVSTERLFPRRVGRDISSGRAILDRAVVHIPDVERDPDYAPDAVRAGIARSYLSVPMLREGVPVGAIGVSRATAGPFNPEQIALLSTFADQAVIAIENVRLFRELEMRNRDLTQALEQQTATSEILRVMSRSQTDAQPVFDAIVESAVALCGGLFSTAFRFDGELVHLAAQHNVNAEGLAGLRRIYPAPPSRGLGVGRAILDRAVIHIPDIEDDAEFQQLSLARAIGWRSALIVPMLREGAPIGVVTVGRALPGLFSDGEIELLKTFADQAVIAVENVRLFTELERRNRDLTQALEQQTATSEILRVISSSPGDLGQVFEAMLANAVRLCEASFGNLLQYDGDAFRHVALHNAPPGWAAEQERDPVPPRDSARVLYRVPETKQIVHVADIAAENPDEPIATIAGARTLLIVPMLKENKLIGVIAVYRQEVRLFGEQQIDLLKTFADQAVIAIENVRLFNETKEALDRQTATAEVLRVISSSPTDLQPVFDTIVRNAVSLCGAAFGGLHQIKEGWLTLDAQWGMAADDVVMLQRQVFPLSLSRGSVTGRAILDRAVIHIPDIREDPEYRTALMKTMRDYRTVLGVPMIREGISIGALALWRPEVRAFSETEIGLVRSFADQAVIAIENVRLFTELQEKNQALTQAHATVSVALDRQTATAEILGVISSSPTDIQPVFATIADSAMRLLAAWSTSVWRYEDGLIRLVAARGGLPGSSETFIEQRRSPAHPAHDSPASQTVLTRMVFHSADVEADPSWGPPFRAEARMRGFRSIVAVPMLRAKDAVGVIAVTRAEVGGFTPAETALLKTFADQAVIAIENVRLFKELEARTQDLTRSVSELRALSEVGQAISSTLDLQTVLSTIVARATNLSGTDAGVIYEYDEQRDVFLPRATAHLEAEIVETMLATPVRKGEGATGRLAEVQEPIQVPDILAAPSESRVRGALVRAGYRALLAIPLAREGHLIGGLTAIRKATGAFAPQTIELLQTFATQSSLAIQNARLFREIEIKSRELEVASQHKSEFLANMSHELRTPMNAILGFSEVLADGMFGEINDKQAEYLRDILESGRHLLSLINDILDLSKIEAGRMELEPADFDLPSAIDNALTLVRERAGRRGITLGREIDKGVGMIRGDERKVKQIVLNLLSNAIKFTPEGGRIEVRATVQDGLAEVSVTDTGVGIAPEDQQTVFEEFRQVGTADKKVEGTGLGLALSRKFVELHGGRIWVKSEVGEGSTFTFTLPIRGGDKAVSLE